MNPTVLARAAIEATITPRFCEQALLPIIKRRLAEASFPPETLTVLFERWDIDAARRKHKWAKQKLAAARKAEGL